MITKTFNLSVTVADGEADGLKEAIQNKLGDLFSGEFHGFIVQHNLTEMGGVSNDSGIKEYQGLKVGQTFKHRRSTFTIVGFNPNKPKNCVRIQNQNGKVYICSVGFCNMLIDGTAPSNW